MGESNLNYLKILAWHFCQAFFVLKFFYKSNGLLKKCVKKFLYLLKNFYRFICLLKIFYL